jgi:membrane-bound lytic murein transglycosylase D
MKLHLTYIFILLASGLSAQNDTIFLKDSAKQDTISLNNLKQKGIKVIRVDEKSSIGNQTSNTVKSDDKNLISDTLQLTIDNVVLKDLPNVKRMDSLWFKELYQPVLFDSINALKTNLDSLSSNIELDSIDLKKKLSLLNQKTQLDIVYHPALERTIKAFLKNRKKSLGRLFGMAEYYFPIFEEKLAKYDIPLEMKYLAIVESALNPRALSRAGAGGLWQFMYSTGKVYGLEINNYVDERFDPLQETEAACKHMQDLYRIFKDWNLVLAAYNSGAGNVTKAIRRSGGYTNYWNIRPYLPRETAGYVPLFQATLFLGEYAKDYGIKTTKPDFHYIATDTIIVKHNITFDQISRLLKISIEELEFLNPQYKLNIIPYVEDQHYALKLPLELVGIFVTNEALIQELVQKEFNRKEKPLPKFYKLNNYIVYRVRPGDYLGRIARKFHTTVRSIKRWNGLRSNRLRIGQKLKIFSRYAIATSSAYDKPKKLRKKLNGKNKKIIRYEVKPGDTLWNISRRYNVSLSELMKWNKLKKNQKLKPGMTLKIYKS